MLETYILNPEKFIINEKYTDLCDNNYVCYKL